MQYSPREDDRKMNCSLFHVPTSVIFHGTISSGVRVDKCISIYKCKAFRNMRKVTVVVSHSQSHFCSCSCARVFTIEEGRDRQVGSYVSALMDSADQTARVAKVLPVQPRAGRSLFFQVRSPLNFYPWIAIVLLLIRPIFRFARRSIALKKTVVRSWKRAKMLNRS